VTSAARSRTRGAGLPGAAWAAVLYAALTLALSYPLSTAPHRLVWADDPDTHLTLWILSWDAHAFVHHPWTIFDANIFAPERHTLAYSENMIGSAFIAAPVLWLSGNPVLALNVVSLSATVLCGLGAYVLARRAGLGGSAATLAGLIFAFSPPRFLRYPQIHVAAVQWIPFSLAALHAYFERGRRRDLWLAIGFFTLQTLTSGHGGMFLLLATAIMIAYRALIGQARPVRWLTDVGLVGILLLLPAALMLIPYRAVQAEQGLRRVLGADESSLWALLASPTPAHVWMQSLLTRRDINAAVDAFLFPGLLPLALGLAATVMALKALRRTHQRPARRWLAVAASAGVAWMVLGGARAFTHAGDGLAARFAPNGVTWTGYLTVARDGTYHIATTSAGSAQVVLDETIVISRDEGAVAFHPLENQAGIARLTAGAHRVLIDYSQIGGGAWQCALYTALEGEPFALPPPWALSSRPVTLARVMAVRLIDAARVLCALAAIVALLWWLSTAVRAYGRQTERAEERSQLNAALVFVIVAAAALALAIGSAGAWRWVYWLPGFDFIRTPSRFIVLGVLALAILAATAFEWLTARLSPRGRGRTAVVVGALLLAEFSGVALPSTPFRVEYAGADRWIAGQPGLFTIAEVPSSRWERLQSTYMLHSMAHWQRTVHGYSGILPDTHRALYDALERFPDAAGIRALRQFDVAFVIVHLSMYAPDARPALLNALEDSRDLELKYADSEGRVYAVRH